MSGVILTELAASPHTPRVVLDHLTRHVLTLPTAHQSTHGLNPGVRLRIALASNPALATREIHQVMHGVPLSHGRPLILAAALARPGTTPATAIAILGQDHTSGALLEALNTVPDPDGVLLTHALAHGSGAQLCSRLLHHPALTYDQQTDLVTRLVTGKKLSIAHTAQVVAVISSRLAAAPTAAEHRAERAWVKHLAKHTNTPTLIPRLTDLTTSRHTRLLISAAPRLRDLRTPVGGIIDWASAGGPERFAKAVRHRRDPHARILTAAGNIHGPHPDIAAAVLATPDGWYDRPTRQRAATTLLRHTALPEKDAWKFGKLAGQGDPDLAVELVLTWPTDDIKMVPPVATMLLREDLTDTHLDAISDHYTRHEYVYRMFAQTPPGLFGLWLATYPTARADQRTTGWALADEHLTTDHPHRALLPALAALDPANPGTVAAAGLAVPLPDSRLPHLPGIKWLVRTTLAHHLGPNYTPEAAQILTMLATTPTEPMTLTELLDTTTAIAT